MLWFTGQNGVYGTPRPEMRHLEVFDAPTGPRPLWHDHYAGRRVYYASLAGNHIAHGSTGRPVTAMAIGSADAGQGARRLWADSSGRIWVSEWNAGQLGLYDPVVRDAGASGSLPGDNPPAVCRLRRRSRTWSG